jgi:hypothetical protein
MASTEHQVNVVTSYAADEVYKFMHDSTYGPPIITRGSDGELTIKRRVKTFNGSAEYVVAIYQADAWLSVEQKVGN